MITKDGLLIFKKNIKKITYIVEFRMASLWALLTEA